MGGGAHNKCARRQRPLSPNLAFINPSEGITSVPSGLNNALLLMMLFSCNGCLLVFESRVYFFQG